MTDERMGDDLWSAIRRLPRGGGIVFRHYATPIAERRRLFAQVLRLARARRLIVLCGGQPALRRADGGHNRQSRGRGWRTFAVHGQGDLVAARRADADAVFVSPLFATRSHPHARALGVVRLGLLIRGVTLPVIALGGMDQRRMKRLRGLNVYGWAGIDAWLSPPGG